MADTCGSSDPSMKTDDAAANDNDWATATANKTPKMDNTTTKETGGVAAVDEAPAAEAPAALPSLAGYCVVVLTDPEGNAATIGSLRAAESPACMLRLGKLIENRETSLFLRARFPRFASDGEPFQRIGLHFYGDAFETFESDIVMTKVNELEELPELLMDRVSVLNAAETNLYKLQLTYKPEKVVTKAKDGPDTFSMPESSRPYELFRSLVECETPRILTLYFEPEREGYDAVHAVNEIRDRLKYEKDVMPSVEYRNKYGKIVIQYGKILA